MGLPSTETITPVTPILTLNQVYFWHPELWSVERNNRRRTAGPALEIYRHRVTIAWRLVSPTRVEYSASFCAPSDAFNKRQGRVIAGGRLQSGVNFAFDIAEGTLAHAIRREIINHLRAQPFTQASRELHVPRSIRHWTYALDYNENTLASIRDVVVSIVTNQRIPTVFTIDVLSNTDFDSVDAENCST